MQFVPIPHVSELELRYALGGQVCENTFYFYDATDALPDSYSTFDTVVQNAWEGSIMPMQSNQLAFVGIKWTDLSSDIAPGYEHNYTTALPGEDTSPSLPENCAAVITFHTPYRGRSTRGRIYVPGVPQTAHTAGLLSTVYKAHAANFSALWHIMTNGTLSIYHCVASRQHNGVRLAEGKSYLVDSYSMNATVCSQRRRLPGRGI